MQFIYPNILYALAALLIPVFIHLFQLRKFRTVPFTNVAFLKKVKIQTRKSSQLKKWLTLLARLLAFLCLIIAFARPYWPSQTNQVANPQELVVYLDDSQSMEAKGDRGALLSRAVQDLLETIPQDKIFSLFTNTESYPNTTVTAIRDDLLQRPYTSVQLPYASVARKAQRLFSKQSSTTKNLVWVSDFQQRYDLDIKKLPSNMVHHFTQVQPEAIRNIKIDTAFAKYLGTDNTIQLQVKLSRTGATPNDIAVALYNTNQLVTKSSVTFEDDSTTAGTDFALTLPSDSFRGELRIEDAGLSYDNSYFFSINPPKKLRVLCIGNSETSFLTKIYPSEEFDLLIEDERNIDFSLIPEQNVCILYELPKISIELSNTLQNYIRDGGTLLVIPPAEGTLSGYATLLSSSGLTLQTPAITNERRITTIAFSHPLYTNVFDQEVTNFQYPLVESYYRLNGGNTVLGFEDGLPFLSSSGNVYVFASALNAATTNFKQSPLIVPTFYSAARRTASASELSYTLNRKNTLTITTEVKPDQVLTLQKDEGQPIIPQQKQFAQRVEIITNDILPEAGIYAVKNQDSLLQYTAFNYDRAESDLFYHNFENTNTEIKNQLSETLVAIEESTQLQELWKWFLIFALLFLVIELLILKYLP